VECINIPIGYILSSIVLYPNPPHIIILFCDRSFKNFIDIQKYEHKYSTFFCCCPSSRLWDKMSPANHSSISELFQQIGQRTLQGGVISLEGHQLPDGGKVNLEHIAADRIKE